MPDFTKNQQKAIDTIDNNVIVSASAGSGKTTVMIERIKRLILKKKVDVKNLLVVTFVNAAASDIKEKLRNAIINEYEKNKDEFLYETLNDLPLSNISTLHSFCNDLVKTYFYKLNILPKYNIVESEELALLKNKAIENVLEKYYESAENDFVELVDIFKESRSDSKFKEIIFKIYEFLSAKVDINEFLEQTVLNAYSDNQTISTLLELFNKTICAEIENSTAVVEKYLQEFERYGMDAHFAHATRLKEDLKKINTKNSIQKNVLIIKNFEFEDMPRAKKDFSTDMLELKDNYKEFKGTVKDQLDKKKEKYDYEENEDFFALIKDNFKYVKLLVEIVKAFDEEFSNLKRQGNVLDFSDLEKFTIKLLKDENIKKELSEKYEYVFVDEYQDINPVQEYILKSISNGRNMFMVGDVKQSIYGFRLCSPRIFLNKYDAYKQNEELGYALELNENFRSEKNVLDFNNAVFSSIMTKELGGVDYLASSMLKAGREIKKLNAVPTTTIINIESEKKVKEEVSEVYSVRADISKKKPNKAYLEARTIESYILKLVGKEKIFTDDNEEGRYVKYSDIVILVRDMKDYSNCLYKALSESGLPIIADLQEDTGMEILTLIDALKLVDNIKQDIPLLSVMRSCIGSFTDEELAEVRIYANKKNKNKLSFLDAINLYIEKCSNELADKLNEFVNRFKGYNAMSSFMSVNELVSMLIIDSGFDIYVSSLKNGNTRLSKVNNFIINISKSSYRNNLSEYLSSIVEEEEKLKNGGASTISENAIRFMTIHKSKGLEFPIVIYANASQRAIKQTNSFCINDDFGIGIDSYDFKNKVKKLSPISEVINYQNRINDIFEQIRILYVCLTRAKNHILITSMNAKTTKFVPNEFNISFAKTYLDFIMQGVRNLSYKELVEQSIELINLTEGEILVKDVNLDVKIDFVKADSQKAKALRESLNKPYDYLESTNTYEKYTVTEINNINKEIAEEKNAPKSLLPNDDAIYEGILYHTIFQNIDLNASTIFEVQAEIDRMLESGILLKDDILHIEMDKLVNALNSEFIRQIKDYKIFREIPFMLRERGSKYGIKTNDFVIIQGQIDLLAVGKDKAIVVDFKNSRLGNAIKLKETYKNQLMVYADAVQNIFGSLKVERYIFSLKESNAIKV